MSVRHLKDELLRPALEHLVGEEGATTAIEVENELNLGGVEVEYVYRHADDSGLTLVVATASLAQRLLETLER